MPSVLERLSVLTDEVSANQATLAGLKKLLS
jgi:hypothetical protein